MRANANIADLVLHPQRLAIIRVLGMQPLTTRGIAELLPEIPQATLYRHLSQLLDGGLIRIVAERQVRGTAERTYAVGSAALLTAEDVANATPEDHMRYFATFAAGLLGEFSRYVEQGDLDLARDGVSYREHPLLLSDAELRDMLTEVRAVIARYTGLEPAPERSARLLATVTLPTRNRKDGE